jgi:hypothetical protein
MPVTGASYSLFFPYLSLLIYFVIFGDLDFFFQLFFHLFCLRMRNLSSSALTLL